MERIDIRVGIQELRNLSDEDLALEAERLARQIRTKEIIEIQPVPQVASMADLVSCREVVRGSRKLSKVV